MDILSNFDSGEIASPLNTYCPLCNHRRNDGCKQSRDGQGWLCLRSTSEELTGEDGVRYLRTKALRDQMGGLYLPAKERIPVRPDRPQTVAADHRLIHRLIWDHASEELGGRFRQKLTDAAIQDTYYSRYLTTEAIASIESTIEKDRIQKDHPRVYNVDQMEASGFFWENRGMQSPRWRLKIPVGRVLSTFNLQGEFIGIRANPEVPLWVKKKNKKAKELQYLQAARVPPCSKKNDKKTEELEELKYLQAAGVPLHPYIPRATRERLHQLWANDERYLLVITEGEDTTEAPAQNLERLGGLPVVFIGLPGVEGWQGASKSGLLHPELQRVLARAAQLVLAFDSDIMAKKEVRSAMVRLSNAVMSQLGGRLIPLAANWPQVLRTETTLDAKKYGLDDLIGEWVRRGADVQAVFEKLLAPEQALMVKRTWQRKGTPWTVESLPPLLTVEEAYQATEQSVKEWLTQEGVPRRVIATTPGVGKTEAVARGLFSKMQAWSATGHGVTAHQLQQQIQVLEGRKNPLITEIERYGLLKEIREKRKELLHFYQETLGGPLLALFPNLQALYEFQARLRHLNGGVDPNWLAIRVGREAPDPTLANDLQIGHGSLICGHHEPVSQVGNQRHSPSALACSTCFWGQAGRCGFLDSIKEAHLAPVVLATAQAVLNASEEITHFTQVIVDEDLPHHLFEVTEVGQHLPLLIRNLQYGLQYQFWEELYEQPTLEALLTVLIELEVAQTRYRGASPQERLHISERVTDWIDQERIHPSLTRLRGLRPLRLDMEKREVVAATYYPWERPRYQQTEDGPYLHQATYGEEQRLEFESIPLRVTDALLETLVQGLVEGLAGANLTFEAVLEPQNAASEGQRTQIAPTASVRLHLYRPHQHLIESLSQSRILNLDATPNRLLLQAFFPDIQVEEHQCELNVEIIQFLSAPPGRIADERLKDLIPALKVWAKQGPTLLMTHKKGAGLLKQWTAQEPIEGLIAMISAQGESFPASYYGYHDRAFDDPRMKAAKTMVLAGAYVPNLGHLKRLSLMLQRFLALQNRPLPACASAQQPYRVQPYGPEGYELIEASPDPLLGELIFQERSAALIQAINRPRPARRADKLRVILYRSDPLPAPYNRYVQVLGSVEELFGVALPLKNKANAARLLEAWYRHGEMILAYFIKYKTLPSAREIQKLAGGSRGKAGSITRALAWFSAQVLPHLPNETPSQNLLQQALAKAVQDFYSMDLVPRQEMLDEDALEDYWIERYRQGTAAQRVVTWLCTRRLAVELQQKLEAIQSFIEVVRALHKPFRSLPP
jgi:Domain of unknown function (DUF3854)